MSRIGLGRHRRIEGNVGDPLDGLVNLFDVGMILAIAFLIAGLGLTLNLKTDKFEARQGKRASGHSKVIQSPSHAPKASGRGVPVGQVYRLPDGRLVYVKHHRRSR
jgi:hypothetical protein